MGTRYLILLKNKYYHYLLNLALLSEAAGLHANSAVGKVIGINKVDFYNTKSTIYYYKPEVSI